MSHQGVLIGVVVYFALACAALALLFLPAARGAAWAWCVAGWVRLRRIAAGSAAHARQARQEGLHAGGLLRGWLRRRGAWVAAALLVIGGVPALALALRGWVSVDAFDHTAARPTDARVAALLQGEQLVPPPPLPPELFVTQEVERARPMARYASREWALLDDSFRQRLLLVFKQLREQHGYEAVLIEGYRSPERQTLLAQYGPTVTHAGAGQSYHQYGLAADVAFLREGRIVISERDPWAMGGYEAFGEVAEGLGLTWGGRWRTLRDFGHVEWRRNGKPIAGGPAAPPVAGR